MKIRLFAFLLSLFLTVPDVMGQEEALAGVRGRVTTLWGEPLEEAEVFFYLLEWDKGQIVSAEGKLAQRVVTDKQGNYKASNLPWGQYRIRVELRGLGNAETWRFYLWRGANRVFDIGIPIGNVHHLAQILVTGIVRDANKVAIPDATVTLVCAFNSSKFDQVRTDKEGRYEFGLIQPGQYILYAAKPGHMMSAVSLDLGNGSRETREIVLRSGKPKYVQSK